MANTIVLQSHRQPLPASWIETCTNSVMAWAKHNGFAYQFLGDELFEYVSAPLQDKTRTQPVIATDLARLKALQGLLQLGFESVIWCDADFLIFNPEQFILPNETFAIGREVWIQADKRRKLSAHIKVHNAFLMFRQGNSFLNFYAEAAERLLTQNDGSMPPQFIGPKLLTAIHNVVQCPVMESAGMLSPLVSIDIANGGGNALDLFKQKSTHSITAANLCGSLISNGELNDEVISNCAKNLLNGFENY